MSDSRRADQPTATTLVFNDDIAEALLRLLGPQSRNDATTPPADRGTTRRIGCLG
jgi:hypothetical protein